MVWMLFSSHKPCRVGLTLECRPEIQKLLSCKTDLYAIGGGISCIIFILLSDMPFDAGAHTVHCIKADCSLPLKVKKPGAIWMVICGQG